MNLRRLLKRTNLIWFEICLALFLGLIAASQVWAVQGGLRGGGTPVNPAVTSPHSSGVQ